MNAMICSDPRNFDKEKVERYRVSGAVEAVTAKTPLPVACENPKYNVVLLDYGKKKTLCASLLSAAAMWRLCRAAQRRMMC